MRRNSSALAALAAICWPAWAQAAESATSPAPVAPVQTVAQGLGFGTGERLLIIHADDAGMCHSANVGTIEAMTRGVVNSASVMVPCSWMPEMAAWRREHPDLDIGVHGTLTSEWRHYRWRPVVPFDEVPGLIDPEGFLWRGVKDVALHAKADEVERELRAQVKRAIDFGLKPTHLDTHMGTVYARPDFFAAYRKVALEFRLPYLLPRLSDERLAMMDPLTRVVAAAIKNQMAGSPEFTLDDLVSIEGDVPLEKQKDFYMEVIRKLKPGITQIIIHCGVEGDELKAVTGSHARRDMDRQAFCDPEVKRLIESEGVRLITWREIGERQRKHHGLHADKPG